MEGDVPSPSLGQKDRNSGSYCSNWDKKFQGESELERLQKRPQWVALSFTIATWPLREPHFNHLQETVMIQAENALSG